MKIKSKFTLLFTLAVALFTMSSCVDYLEKDPDTNVSSEEAFKNFMNFQGFIEEIYNGIPHRLQSYYITSFNLGDDELFNSNSLTTWRCIPQFDQGNFWCWQGDMQQETESWLDKPSWRNDITSQDRFCQGLWSNAWYCIRKANLGIENIGLMIDATDEERDLVLGQCYFMRAWWHFSCMMYLGGLPYVDSVLPADVPELPRLTFQEAADKCAEDFRMAADLLPIDWDDTTAGLASLNANEFYANKISSLAYLGKTYLWAGSPLMEQGAQLNAIASGATYGYNTDYCEKAASALGELLALVESGATQYSLSSYDYSNVYDHEANSGVSNIFYENFYTIKSNFKQPGSTETIFKGPHPNGHTSVWSFGLTWGPKMGSIVKHDVTVHHPTANVIEAYGMANGYPIPDMEVKDGISGYDPEYPYKGRDPRFYHDVIFDGFKYILGSFDSDADEYQRYATLYTGGFYRDNELGTRTGYYFQKFVPHQMNKIDLYYDWGNHYTANIPWVRLADVYLMYAEAGAAAGGYTYSSSNCDLTALDAINRIRQRCGAGDVQASYYGDTDFIDEIRRERAVELAMEGHRFNDLQRWLLLTEPAYVVKYAHDFNRVEADSYYTDGNDPANAQVSNFKRTEVLTRELGVKHYWLPLKIEDISVFEGFDQNPGW